MSVSLEWVYNPLTLTSETGLSSGSSSSETTEADSDAFSGLLSSISASSQTSEDEESTSTASMGLELVYNSLDTIIEASMDNLTDLLGSSANTGAGI